MKSYLTSSGWEFEDREPVEILGTRMERVRMKRSGGFSALGFDGQFFHVVRLIGLTRALTPKETVDFNASTQMFNVTPSDQPLGAVVKAHIPSPFGLPSETILAMLTYLDDASEKLISSIGTNNVRHV